MRANAHPVAEDSRGPRRCSAASASRPENDWGFFFSMDFETLAKMDEGRADPIYKNFAAEVIGAHVREQLALTYEMEPGKDVRYS